MSLQEKRGLLLLGFKHSVSDQGLGPGLQEKPLQFLDRLWLKLIIKAVSLSLEHAVGSTILTHWSMEATWPTLHPMQGGNWSSPHGKGIFSSCSGVIIHPFGAAQICANEIAGANPSSLIGPN